MKPINRGSGGFRNNEEKGKRWDGVQAQEEEENKREKGEIVACRFRIKRHAFLHFIFKKSLLELPGKSMPTCNSVNTERKIER